jgi:exonuclease 1
VKRVFFAMDNEGTGYEINLENLSKLKKFKNFNFDMFLTACIFSGCDYLSSPKGVGLVKAIKMVEE